MAPVAVSAGSVTRGLDHVGITVPDLEQAKTFSVEVLGCQHAYDLGPFADPNGTWMADHVGSHKDAVARIAKLTCGLGSNIELFSFESPTQSRQWPQRDDYGAASIGFYVDDLNATIAHLKQHNVELLGDVTHVKEGPLAGRSWIYGRAPWGQLLFFASEPDGNAYDKTGPVKLFSARG